MNDPPPISLVEPPPKLVKADVSRILRADTTPDSLTGDSSGVDFSEPRVRKKVNVGGEKALNQTFQFRAGKMIKYYLIYNNYCDTL